MTHDGSSLTLPDQIGPYKIRGVLGEGGMGVVYLAEQHSPVRRRVALKVLKLGMDSKQVVARFESERQALAVMDHPNISKVLDSGVTDDGRPYFVMELVHGTPITDYADTHRLTTEERLRLFIHVCLAVQHAHQKGVIHRDLKPSNVLVSVQDAALAVKVIDFGIAKAIGMDLTDRTLVTRAGQILGTPEYMSPEQAEMSGLDVDTRTDIYSLGVMLYELIVGVLPFDLTAKPDYVISYTLREQDVPRPSTRLTSMGEGVSAIASYRRTTPEALRRELRGDLDWIILKCMNKDRTHRYETANGLAVDIQRHLDDEPVRARPPSTRDRMGKFVRRNRAGVVAASVAIIAVLAGSAAATAGFVQARDEQRRAEREAETAQRVSDLLVDLFRVSDPGEARGSTITAREVLDRGRERIPTELADQPVVQARMLRNMGSVYGNLGLYDDASQLMEQALAVAERTPDIRSPELALTLGNLGVIYRIQGRTTEAEGMLRRAVDLYRRGGAATDSTAFAFAVRSLANVYLVMGRFSDAQELLREALAIQERLHGPDDPAVGQTLGTIGGLLLNERRAAEAEPYLRRAFAITEREYGPTHSYTAEELINIGAMHYMLDRLDEAEEAYNRAFPILESALGPNHPHVAAVLNNLGEIHWRRGNYDHAEAQLLQALELKQRVLGPDHSSVATTLKVLANVYRDQGRYDEAEPLYNRSIAVYTASLSEPSPAMRETLEAYARLLRLTNRDDMAAAVERRAATIPTGSTGS
jgi:eukaryotic-like serine/threonine-protein kinase